MHNHDTLSLKNYENQMYTGTLYIGQGQMHAVDVIFDTGSYNLFVRSKASSSHLVKNYFTQAFGSAFLIGSIYLLAN